MPGVESRVMHAAMVAQELGIGVVPATMNPHMSYHDIAESVDSGALHVLEPLFAQTIIVTRQILHSYTSQDMDGFTHLEPHNKREIMALAHNAAAAMAGCVKLDRPKNSSHSEKEFEEIEDHIPEDLVAAVGALSKTKVAGTPHVDPGRARDIVGDNPTIEQLIINHKELFEEMPENTTTTPVASLALSAPPQKVHSLRSIFDPLRGSFSRLKSAAYKHLSGDDPIDLVTRRSSRTLF